MSPSEARTARWVAMALLSAGLLRAGADRRRGEPRLPRDTTELLPVLLERSQAAIEGLQERNRPLGRGERLDPNRAPAWELDRLPGVGPTVAEAIVRERESGGAFREPEDLLRVRGIGPKTLTRLREHLDLSGGPPAALRTRRAGRSAGPAPVDLNRASESELRSLPGIGPKLADRIVKDRRRRGPFSSVDELVRVRGIGPVIVERLRTRVRVAVGGGTGHPHRAP